MDLEHVSWEKGGEEEVCICPECYRPKFYLNSKSLLFTCFHCGLRGALKSTRTGGGKANQSQPETTRDVAETIVTRLHERNLQEVEYLLLKRPRITPYDYPAACSYPVWEDLGLLYAAGYLCGEWVGHQSYHPHTKPKYRYTGKRGIFRPLESCSKQAILCEGVFDCLCLASKPMSRNWEVICSFGNSLTDNQLEDIVAMYSRVALAFDNDKLGAYSRAYSLLLPYVQVINFMPPKGSGAKDWDDYFGKGIDPEDLDLLRLCSVLGGNQDVSKS